MDKRYYIMIMKKLVKIEEYGCTKSTMEESWMEVSATIINYRIIHA